MNDRLCPLCGRLNRCAQADPQTAHLPCWCFSQRIDPGVLERLPEAARDLSCLCPDCSRGADPHDPALIPAEPKR
ncbi:MAG: cysteine-rich CWC family protein [Pseudomonadota bacterium]